MHLTIFYKVVELEGLVPAVLVYEDFLQPQEPGTVVDTSGSTETTTTTQPTPSATSYKATTAVSPFRPATPTSPKSLALCQDNSSLEQT